MKIRLKMILLILISPLLLGLVVLVTVPLLVDVNDFKAEIETVVAENTGRKLTIEGDLDLSIFPWLGVSTGKMTLSNPKGFNLEPFAQITEAQIKVKLWPLLFKQIQVSNIVLKGVRLNLSKNTQGVSNWDDLVALIQSKPEEKSPLKLLEIAGIVIQDAQMSWHDLQTGQQIEVKEAELNTEKLVFNQPVAFDLAFTAHDLQNHLTETVDFSGRLTLTEELDNFNLSKIQLKTQTESKSIPTGKLLVNAGGEVKLDLTHKSLKLTPLHIKVGDITFSASTLINWFEKSFKIRGLLHIDDFDVANFMQKQLQIKLPQMIDENALTWMTADLHVEADEKHVKLENVELQLDETTIKGSAQIQDFAKPAINFNLALDKVNVDRYLPPPVVEKSIQNPQMSLNDSLSESAAQVPVESLKKLDLNGQLTISELKVKNLTMQGVRFLVNAKNGVLQSQQSVDRLYQGSHQSKIIFDVNGKQPLLSLNGQLTHVQIEPFLSAWQGQSRFAGLMNLNAKLEGSGNNDIALKSSLNGRVHFLAEDMVVRGFDLQKMMDDGKILLGDAQLANQSKKDRTFFSNLSGTVIVSNGFLLNNDLLGVANRAKVNGMGEINLASKQLDYKIIAILLKEKALSQMSSSPHLPVFIHVGGNFNAPTYQVDLAAMGVDL